jgi:hypothetical protein
MGRCARPASTGDSAIGVFQLTDAVGGGDAAALRILMACAPRAANRCWYCGVARAVGAGHRHPRPTARYRPLTARAVRADRLAKGLMRGEVWDELTLLTADLCGQRVLPLARWQLQM